MRWFPPSTPGSHTYHINIIISLVLIPILFLLHYLQCGVLLLTLLHGHLILLLHLYIFPGCRGVVRKCAPHYVTYKCKVLGARTTNLPLKRIKSCSLPEVTGLDDLAWLVSDKLLSSTPLPGRELNSTSFC